MITPTHAENCRGCGAQIFWVKHEKTGKAAPIDVGPNPAGNIRLELTNDGWRYGIIRPSQAVPPEERFMPHFATCTRSRDFRRLAASPLPGATPVPDPRQLPDNVIPFPTNKTSRREGE